MSAMQESQSSKLQAPPPKPAPVPAPIIPRPAVTPTPPDIYVNAVLSDLRANVAERYCTKDDARDIKTDVNNRLNDIWKVILGVIVPVVLALLALIGKVLGLY